MRHIRLLVTLLAASSLSHCRPAKNSEGATKQAEVYDGNVFYSFDKFYAATRSEDGKFDCWFVKDGKDGQPSLVSSRGVIVSAYEDAELPEQVNVSIGQQAIDNKKNSITGQGCSIIGSNAVVQLLNDGHKKDLTQLNTSSASGAGGTCLRAVMKYFYAAESNEANKFLSRDNKCTDVKPPLFFVPKP